MWEHFIEELLALWAFLSLNPEEKEKLLGKKTKEKKDKDEENS